MINSTSIQTYSPSDVTLIIAGYRVTGWESINILRNKKSFNVVEGIRGKNTRVRNRSSSATLSFNLLQTVQSNEVLSYIHELDNDQGTGRLVITLKDSSGKSVFSSSDAFITGYPAVKFSGDFEYRVWEIHCQTTESYVIAGNSRPQTTLFDGALDKVSNFVSDLI